MRNQGSWAVNWVKLVLPEGTYAELQTVLNWSVLSIRQCPVLLPGQNVGKAHDLACAHLQVSREILSSLKETISSACGCLNENATRICLQIWNRTDLRFQNIILFVYILEEHHKMLFRMCISEGCQVRDCKAQLNQLSTCVTKVSCHFYISSIFKVQ